MKNQFSVEFLDYFGETHKIGHLKTAGIKDAFSLLALTIKNQAKIIAEYSLSPRSIASHLIIGATSGQQETILRDLFGHPLKQPLANGQMESKCSHCKTELTKTWHIIICDERDTQEGDILPQKAKDAGVKIDDFLLKPAHRNPTQKYIATICPHCYKIEIFENKNGWYILNTQLTKLFN